MENSSLDHEDSRAECQRYLTSFRVLELKELLKLYGQSTKGRKPELFQRANDILQYASPKFHSKVREIYERTNTCKRRLSYNRSQKNSATGKNSETVLKNPSRSYIVHPDVRFKIHPFFSKLETIIRPTALVSSSLSGHGSLSMKLKFHLTPQQIHQIYVSKTSTGTYQTQVLVRFCLQETTSDQNDFYPRQCYLKVNAHNCPIPGYHPHLSTRGDYKRNGQPINATNFVKTSPAEINEVGVYWTHDIMLSQGYCVGVEIAEVVSASDLLSSLKAKGVRSPDMSRALVKEKFSVDKDSEVAATSMRVSLLCPIGKMRMSYPCRTTFCNHLQCFDASIFFQMNEKRARWVCPVCDKVALPGDLFIDGLFMDICQKSPSSDSVIEFSCDGSWLAMSENKGSSPTPDMGGNVPINIDTPESSSKKANVVVIDLTASSDEEEEEEEEGEEEEEMRVHGEGKQLRDSEREDRSRPDHHMELHIETRGEQEETISSDSESTVSSHSSSTVAAPSPPEPHHPNLFPRLSVPLSEDHVSRFMFPAPLHSHVTLPHTTDRSSRQAQQQQSELSGSIPTSSVPRFSSDSHQATATASSSSSFSSSSSSSASHPMSVIMQSHPYSVSRHQSHSHSHPQSSSHSHPQSSSHSRIRKRSHSGSRSHTFHFSRPHSSRPHPSHPSHSSHSHHTSHRKHTTHSSSHPHYSLSGDDSGGEGASEPYRGIGHLAPYVPLATAYPTAGDALLATSNILSFDENILNLFRANFLTTSQEQSYTEPPQD